LVEREAFIHEREDVDRWWWCSGWVRGGYVWNIIFTSCAGSSSLCFFDLHRVIEFAHRVLELLLIQQQFTAKEKKRKESPQLVVVRLAPRWEIPQRPSEGRHARPDLASLVLRNGELDVAKNKLVVQLRRLCVVLRSLCVLAHDEMHLSTVVVDIRIVRVVLDRGFETLERLLGVSLLHVHARELDVALRQARHKLDRLLEVGHRVRHAAGEEPVCVQS